MANDKASNLAADAAVPDEYRRGVTAARQGQHHEAIAAFRLATIANPGHARSHADLGAALAKVENYAAAIGALEEAVRLAPGNANARSNLASCYYRLGQFEEGARHAEQVLIANPAHALALRTITSCCLALGDGRKALKGAANLIRVAPSQGAHQLLIRSLMAAGRLDEAESEAEKYVEQVAKAADRAKNSPAEKKRRVTEARFLHARAMRGHVKSLKPTGPMLPFVRRRREDVVALLNEVIRDAPSGEAYLELGNAYHDLHQHEAAEQALRESVELSPNNPEALELLGDVLIERSLNDEAVEMLDRALAINPLQSRALLMRVRTVAEESERAVFHEQIDECLKLTGTRPQDQINWHFAKGQLYDKSKDYEQAFAQYLTAGRLKEEQRKPAGAPDKPRNDPDYDQHKSHYDACQRAFTPAFFASRAAVASQSNRPLFVVGVPRSGTTLMEQILASHPSVVGAGELPEFSSFAARCDKLAEEAGGYPGGIESIPPETLSEFGAEYLAQLERVDSTAGRVVDKMPGNLLHVGLIHTLFPNASIVRIRREPRDVCVSALKNHLDFPLCNLEKTAKFCVACDRLGELWNELLPGRVLHLNYEELVTDLETNVRRLLAHCELEWDDRCLEFYRTERNVRTPSRWQVRKPAYSSSIGAWKRYASALGHLDAILGPCEES